MSRELVILHIPAEDFAGIQSHGAIEEDGYIPQPAGLFQPFKIVEEALRAPDREGRNDNGAAAPSRRQAVQCDVSGAKLLTQINFKQNILPRFTRLRVLPILAESNMFCRNPFPLPDRLNADLQPVFSLWRGLIRAENRMPFADDLDLSVLSRISQKSFLLGVFTSPERFRFEFLEEGLEGIAAGRFVDEVTPGASFSYLRAQGSVAVEAKEPTFLHLTETSGREFSRLLLPMWGNGQINMLLGAVDR